MILDLFRLDGRVALITGAGQGLGQAMAIGLAEAGADIVALDRRESDQTGQAVTALGRRFKSITCNLLQASVTDLQQVVAQLMSDMGHIDVLVNNAGIIRRAPALDF